MISIFRLVLLCLFVCKVRLDVTCDPQPGTPVNTPLGKGKGIFPGRVVWSFKENCCDWDERNGTYYWEHVDQNVVDRMLYNSLLMLTGETTMKRAWQSIFHYFHNQHFPLQKGRGYQKGEKVVIKMNLNVHHEYDEKSNGNGLSPQFLKALLRQLTLAAGVYQQDITIYDADRWFSKFYYDSPYGIGAEYPYINIVDNNGGEKYVNQVQPDMDSVFLFSNTSVANWNGTKLAKCQTEAKYFIVLNDFRGHDLAGVTLTAKNLFGAVYRDDNVCDFGSYNAGHWCPKSLHPWASVRDMPMGSYSCLTDLLGHDDFGGKGLLYLSDGLYSGIAEHQSNTPIRFASFPFDDSWSSSIFTSLDPIALDSVLFDFLRNEPNQPYPKEGCVDNYLHESALADNPPSGTVYNPTGKKVLESLGVHEHWNNAKEKMYSRNFGKEEGIELVKVL